MVCTCCEFFLIVSVTAYHDIDSTLEMLFNRGPRKLKTKLILIAHRRLLFQYEPAHDIISNPSGQQPIEEPPNRPHEFFIHQKRRIIAAQAIAVRDMHPLIPENDIRLFPQTGYAEWLKRCSTREKITISVHKTDGGSAGTEMLQPFKNRQHGTAHCPVIGPEVKKITEDIQITGAGANIGKEINKCLLPLHIVKAKVHVGNEKSIRHSLLSLPPFSLHPFNDQP
jgi:hypothetical protein